MMGHVPRRVGHDACPVGSRAFERPYRDRPASWRLVAPRRAKKMAGGVVSWFAGVAWGSERHQVCLLDAAGQVVDERAFRHGGAGLAALCDWLLSGAGEPGRVAVAIEVPHGPVVDALLDRGFAVHAINPKQLERLRDRVSLAGAKDDRRDARVAAGGLRTDPHLFRPVEAGDPAVIALREWSRLEEELQQERTRLSNRIRQQLWRYYPQLLAVSDDVTAEWVLDLWTLAPTPAKAARLGRLVPHVQQPKAGCRLCGAGPHAMAKRIGPSGPGRLQGGESPATNDHDPDRLAVVAASAAVSADPMVPRADQAHGRPSRQDDDRRPGAQAAGRALEVCNGWRSDRGGCPQARLSTLLPPFPQSTGA